MCGRWNSGCADVLSSPLAYRNLMKGVIGQLMINFGHQGNTSACGDSCTHAERPLCKAGALEGPDFRESPSGNEETTRAPTLFAKTSCRTATTALSLAYALAWCVLNYLWLRRSAVGPCRTPPGIGLPTALRPNRTLQQSNGRAAMRGCQQDRSNLAALHRQHRGQLGHLSN